MKVRSGKIVNKMIPDFAEILVNAFKSKKGFGYVLYYLFADN